MVIQNVKVEWVDIINPNQMSGKYSTDFYFQDKDAEAKFVDLIEAAWEEHKGSFKGDPQSLGYSIKEDGVLKFKATQAPQSNDGKYTFTVAAYDSKAKEIDPKPSIGNGSICNLDVELYPYTFKNKKGVKLNLRAIQVLNLVEFNGQGNNFQAQDDGYEAAPSNAFQDTTSNPQVVI